MNVMTRAANARLAARSRVLAAVAEQREALDHRIYIEDIADIHLEADVRIWGELARALADFLKMMRAAP